MRRMKNKSTCSYKVSKVSKVSKIAVKHFALEEGGSKQQAMRCWSMQ